MAFFYKDEYTNKRKNIHPCNSTTVEIEDYAPTIFSIRSSQNYISYLSVPSSLTPCHSSSHTRCICYQVFEESCISLSDLISTFLLLKSR